METWRFGDLNIPQKWNWYETTVNSKRSRLRLMEKPVLILSHSAQDIQTGCWKNEVVTWFQSLTVTTAVRAFICTCCEETTLFVSVIFFRQASISRSLFPLNSMNECTAPTIPGHSVSDLLSLNWYETVDYIEIHRVDILQTTKIL